MVKDLQAQQLSDALAKLTLAVRAADPEIPISKAQRLWEALLLADATQAAFSRSKQ